jgi:hypothetical protein
VWSICTDISEEPTDSDPFTLTSSFFCFLLHCSRCLLVFLSFSFHSRQVDRPLFSCSSPDLPVPLLVTLEPLFLLRLFKTAATKAQTLSRSPYSYWFAQGFPHDLHPPIFSTLGFLFYPKAEAACSSETSVNNYQTTQRHIPEHRSL